MKKFFAYLIFFILIAILPLFFPHPKNELKALAEKEKFDQLEKEYKAFTRLYKRQWKLAKREIERKLLNIEALKGQKGGKDE